MNRDILVAADPGQAAPSAAERELLTLGRRLADGGNGRVGAALFASPDAAIEAWGAHGADVVYAGRCEGGESAPEVHLAAVAEAARRARPAIVLCAHSIGGMELAPRLAFRLDGAVATGCIEVSIENATVRCTRPCYGGSACEVDEFGAAPVVVTMRAGLFERAQPQPGRAAEAIDLGAFDAGAVRARRIGQRIEAEGGPRLEEARVIVAGGRGLEGPAGFEVLAELARALGGAVGSSRVPCDLGWCPHSWQIGLTGKTVTPDLYIAVGISGAGHHMAGCGNAKTIVAINPDPEAAIFQDARFGVIGDYREVVPALTEAITQLSGASSRKPETL